MTPENSRFIERMGAFGVQGGLPRSAARILGYLSICEPARQSAEEIGAALVAQCTIVVERREN